jgi:hypothetical protein
VSGSASMGMAMAEVAVVPTLTMTESSSTENLQMVSSSASSYASLARIRNNEHQSAPGHRLPWSEHGLPKPSSSEMPFRSSSSSTTTAGRSIVDLFSVVTRDFFQHYSCTRPSGFVVVPRVSASQSTRSAKTEPTQQRDDAPSESEEIEFDEDEILRRDYELSRV